MILSKPSRPAPPQPELDDAALKSCMTIFVLPIEMEKQGLSGKLAAPVNNSPEKPGHTLALYLFPLMPLSDYQHY